MEAVMKLLANSFFLSLVLAAPALADPGNGAYGHPHMFGGDGWGFMMMGPLMMILLLVLVVLLVLGAVRWLGAGGTGAKGSDYRATALLRERFARGEIDEREFEERLRILEGHR
jgi:putative membrane protein